MLIKILIALLMASTASAEWTENNGKREWTPPGQRIRVMVSHQLEMISWPGLPDSTYFKVDVGSITDSIWYSGDTTIIGISEYYHAKFFNDGDAMLKWEAVLYQKPGNQYSWTFPIEYSDNLTFNYQPKELSQEEIDDGAHRPDSVKGSYSVDHKTKGGIVVEGEEIYGIGKAWHAYCPKAWDSADDTVWLDLDIDTLANELTIGGTRKWFREAVYPVTIDPDFGYSSIPGTEGDFPSNALGLNHDDYTYTASSGDIIITYHYYGKKTGAPASIGMAAYTVDANDTLRSRLQAEVTISLGNSADWHVSSTVSHSMSAGSEYAVATGSASGNVQLYYDLVGGALRSRATHADLPATWTTDDHNVFRYGQYVTYTAGGAPAAANRRQILLRSE